MKKFEVFVINGDLIADSNVHYVGLPTPLGNPYTTKQRSNLEAIALYREWIQLQYITGNTLVIEELIKLANLLHQNGHITLSCHCATEPCHADIIALAIRALVNRREINL